MTPSEINTEVAKRLGLSSTRKWKVVFSGDGPVKESTAWESKEAAEDEYPGEQAVEYAHWSQLSDYHNDISAALVLLEKANEMNWSYTLGNCEQGHYCLLELYIGTTNPREICVEAPALSAAITLAFLALPPVETESKPES